MLIRYYGPVGIPTGYGHAANEMCMAILTAGLDLEIMAYAPTADESAKNHLHVRYLPLEGCIRNEQRPPSPDPDVVIVHTLASSCSAVLEATRARDLFPRAHTVAYTAWEANSMAPTIADSLERFDVVWVPSMQAAGTLDRALDETGVRVVPHPFDETLLHHRLTTSELERISRFRWGAENAYQFYNVGAWSRRKNPEGVIQAFLRAFDLRNSVTLVMATPGPEHCVPIHIARSIGAGMKVSRCDRGIAYTRGNLTIVEIRDRMSDDEIRDLHYAGDCFVTASRGEAWNLPAFDAMLASSHIISPRDLGSLDFLENTSATLYRSSLAPAGCGAEVLNTASGAQMQVIGSDITCKDDWWEPDLSELAIHMRSAFVERKSLLHVSYSPVERFGRRAIGQHIKRLIEDATR